jgi:diphosphomevalonate decarboxylase
MKVVIATGGTGGHLFLPRNDSISMSLSDCVSTTTITLDPSNTDDLIELIHQEKKEILDKNTLKGGKAYEQIQRIRNLSGSHEKAHITSHNSFPSDAGIASSASGFAALTSVLLKAYGLEDILKDQKELSRQVRLSGSGSAARSIYGGFVILHKGTTHEECFAEKIHEADHWNLVDLITIVDTGKKEISSSRGHSTVDTSPYYATRLVEMQSRVQLTLDALKNKDFEKLGVCIEADTLSMHAVMMTSTPPALYWAPGSLTVMKEVMSLRKQGIPAYFSIDAGANVHVICQKENAQDISSRLGNLEHIQKILYNTTSELGVRFISPTF